MALISPTECQQRALECAKLAKSAKTTKKRNILYGMSRCWQTLAAHAMRYEQAQDEDED
jgi:hypothetical protein